jgi:hypothetical protein
MQHDASGPVPPQPIRHALPTLPLRRGRKSPDDRRLTIIHQAVEAQGAGYNPEALAEETGVPVDAIRRFAAQVVVTARRVVTAEAVLNLNMVELGMVKPEDATRMGSEALAATLRILGKTHDNIQMKAPARYLTTADVMGLRRLDRRAAQGRRLVTAPQTLCSRCGGRADADGGCTHQRLMRADETTIQGLPHA